MYVMAKGFYGLGGNIAVLVCAMRLAKKLNRQLIVDWKYGMYGGDSHDVYGELFQSPISFPIERNDWNELRVWPNFWQPHISQTRPYPKGVPTSQVTAEMAEAAVDAGEVLGDIIIISRDDKYWHKGEYQDEMGLITRSLIPSVDLQNAIISYKQLFIDYPIIGVHLRHGNGERTVVPPDINWFYDQVDKFLARNSKSKIFLCTDCHAVLTNFVIKYGNRILSTEKNYPILGSGGMHFADTDTNRLNSAKEALLDMWLLAECTYFVGSKSFFSGVSSKLNGGFDRNNSAWWTPKYRSHSIDPDKYALLEDVKLLNFFNANSVLTDGVYYQVNEKGEFDLYYLYDYLGSISSSLLDSESEHIFNELRIRRLY